MPKDKTYTAMMQLGECFFGGVFKRAASMPEVTAISPDEKRGDVTVYIARPLTPREKSMVPRKCNDVPVLYEVGLPPGVRNIKVFA